ncbi:MAG TPA: peptidylprolyl isomerase [Chryseolinea sp.]
MIERAAITLLFVLLFFFSFSQAQVDKKSPITLFTVNKKPVTVEEFIYLYKKNHQDPQKDFTQEKINEYLDLFIKFKLKVEEARSRGFDTTKVFVKEFNGYKDELRKPYLPDTKIIDSLVKLTYARLREEINASHILVAVKQDALPDDTLKAYTKITELRDRILKGADFGQVAAESSDDPSGKTNKGSLGFFTAMQMVYPFESAAYATKVGDVSLPVRSRFGYHIIKVFGRRPARGEVEVSHIMIRTGNAKENVKVKDAIFEVYDQLQAGVKWEELCKQYSEDVSTKENAGRLRPFGTGAMSAVPEFERIAFNLEKPGEISDPFQTQYGWHIMRLERKIPLPPLDEMSTTLKNRVARDERTELSKQAWQSKLRREYNFEENPQTKAKVLAVADSSLVKGKWKAGKTEDKAILFKVNNKAYLVKDFFQYVAANQRSSTMAPEKYIDLLYQQYVDATIMTAVEEKIAREHPEYRYLLKEYYEGILLFDIMEKEVWGKASEDSVGQHAYFNTHRADYTAGERAQVVFYSSGNEKVLEDLKKLIGDGLESKAEGFIAQQKIKVESGYFKKEERAVLQKVPWAKGVYSSENNGMYYLAWLKDILPPGTMSFEEARPSIISDYQTFLEKNWVDKLKGKYLVKINEKGKQYMLQQIQSQG